MTRRRLTLVRHAMPAVDLSVPPNTWQLSPDGRRAACVLTLPAPPYLVASEEPKAVQTLDWAGAVIRDARFNEVARPALEPSTDWREVRRRYVGGERIPDWEPQADVVARFDAGVSSHLDAAATAGCDLVIGTHGMAMTVWLHARGLIADPVVFWDGLGFPQALVVDLSEDR